MLETNPGGEVLPDLVTIVDTPLYTIWCPIEETQDTPTKTFAPIYVPKRLLMSDPSCYFAVSAATKLVGEADEHTSTYPLRLMQILIYIITTIDITNYLANNRKPKKEPHHIELTIMEAIKNDLSAIFEIVDYYQFSMLPKVFTRIIEHIANNDIKSIKLNYGAISKLTSITSNETMDKLLYDYLDTKRASAIYDYPDIVQIFIERNLPKSAVYIVTQVLHTGGKIPYGVLRSLTTIRQLRSIGARYYPGKIGELTIFLRGLYNYDIDDLEKNSSEIMSIYRDILIRIGLNSDRDFVEVIK
jgi:hypothetical protein